jgi:hypothetical protein
MVLCVFGVTWKEGADLEREAQLSRRMAEVVSGRPGFISYKSYVADDGDEIGIIGRRRHRPALCAGQWEATVSRCMQENLTSRGCAPGVRRRTPVQIVTSAPASKRCGAAGPTISARAPFAAYQARRLAGTLRPRATCLPAGQTPRPGRGWVLAASGQSLAIRADGDTGRAPGSRPKQPAREL